MRRIASLLLLCSLLLIPCRAAESSDTPRSNGNPYYIEVNRVLNTATVYTLDGEGIYTVPVRVMVCSVGRQGHSTPLGTYQMNGQRYPWRLMVDGTYAQYAVRIRGQIMFHSVCYTAPRNDCMITEEYNTLGSKASLGCVRLQTADAKWVYDNCASGTIVKIFDSDSPGPLGTGERAVDRITPELENGWDPTDPADNTPWRPLGYDDVRLDAWYLEHVRYCVEQGLLAGTGARTFSPNTAVSYAMAAQMLCRLSGEGGETAGENWYDNGFAWAMEKGLFEGTEPAPNDPISREELILTLSRYETAEEDCPSERLADLSGYRDANRISDRAMEAMRWAVGSGYLGGMPGTELSPEGNVTRAQWAAILHQFHRAGTL